MISIGKSVLFLLFVSLSAMADDRATAPSDDYDPKTIRQTESIKCDGNVCIRKKVKKLRSRSIRRVEQDNSPIPASTFIDTTNGQQLNSGDTQDENSSQDPPTSTTLQAFKDYFTKPNLNGIYVVGGITNATKYKLSGDRFGTVIDTNTNTTFPINSKNRFGWQVGIGYNFAPKNHLFLGVEAFYMEPGVSTLGEWQVPYTVNSTNIQGWMVMNTNAKLNRSFGAKVKIGGHIWRFAVYGIAGYSYNMLSESNYTNNISTSSGITRVSQSNNVGAHGFLYGAGTEFYLTDFLFFRLEYIQNNFSYTTTMNSINQNPTNGTVDPGANLSFHNTLRMWMLTASVGIKFTI